jgi:uncharacterized protein
VCPAIIDATGAEQRTPQGHGTLRAPTRSFRMTDPQAILRRAGTIAVVGCSTRPYKAAHRIPRTLQQLGWRIVPVHPRAEEILGETAYRRLGDIPEPVDLVDVFRPPAEAPGVARQAVAIGAKALWLQLGIRSAEARRIAEDAGLDYVEDDCTGALALRWGLRPAGGGTSDVEADV